MAQSFAFTFVRYKILAMVILSFVFVIIAFSRQDWMREEFSMKMGPIKNIIKASTILNMTKSALDNSGQTDYVDPQMTADLYMKMIPDDSTVNLMFHFGLKTTCFKITAKGLGNPMQFTVPMISWCFNNDVFTDPKSYNIPKGADAAFKYITDEINGLFFLFANFLLNNPIC